MNGWTVRGAWTRFAAMSGLPPLRAAEKEASVWQAIIEETGAELDRFACEILAQTYGMPDRPGLRGFDMDGVICTLGPPYDKCKPLLIPGGRFVIISARPEKAREVTERWLAENGICPEGLYLRRENVAPAMHKIRWCNTLGVEYFYESDLEITRALVRAGIQAFHVRRMK